MPYLTIVEDHGEWFVADAELYIAGPFKTYNEAERELYEWECGELSYWEDDDE